MKRTMVKRLRQLNLAGPHDLFGAIQQAFDTCCEGPTTLQTAGHAKRILPHAAIRGKPFIFKDLPARRRCGGPPGTPFAICPSSANQMPHTKPTQTFRRITMKTLIINDLARAEQLDSGAMAQVRGGFNMGSYGGTSMGDVNYAPSFDSSITATQNLAQMQEVLTATANGAAFVSGVSVHSDVDQDGQNKIVRRS
jgi:hypothetical protein